MLDDTLNEILESSNEPQKTEFGLVQNRGLVREMEQSYLDYAMSVIVARALPDVRDGLKPVHRRVLFAMWEDGRRWNSKFTKCAGIVGEVMKKYHPHGDLAIYDTLVRLAQPWSMRYRLVDGQGNFGCFTKDTKVKLTDGRDVTFEGLVREDKQGKINYTYTLNSLGRISIAPIKKPRLTIKNASLVKVTLDNEAEIRCTPNHLFMLKDGSYVEAQNLTSGMSLMPLYQRLSESTDRLNREGYELIYQPKIDTWVPAHHLADNYNLTHSKYTKSAGRVRHHIDFNKRNNNPDNIIRMSWGEHWKIHYHNAIALHQDKDYQQKIAEGRKIYWSNEANKAKHAALMTGRNKQNWQNTLYREKMRQMLSRVNKEFIQQHPEKRKEFSQRATQTLKRLWQDSDYQAFMHEKIIKGNKNHTTNQTGKKKFITLCQSTLEKYKVLSPQTYEAVRKEVYPYGMAPLWKTGLHKYFQNNPDLVLQEINQNHRVISVEPLVEREDVYDLTIDTTHNFALASGVFVHNSVDGDSPAAMRYTEARLHHISDELLSDIDKDTVSFSPNYDNSTLEPNVLPASLPNLLLNGAQGIAVGMATNIPTHNLNELVDGITHLIDNPEVEVDALMEFVKGPDFPTGANIYNSADIKQAYATGKGRIMMRASAEIEEKKSGFRILVTDLPYQVNKAALIEKIADLVKDKRIDGISDIRDESDRKANVRIVIELKSTAYPKKILNQLYDLTPMQSAFHVNMLALVDGLQPQVLTLKQIFEQFILHRRNVVRRRTEFELRKARDRAHILEGLLIALKDIDLVIETIRRSKDRDEARTNLIAKFTLTEIQANAILDMRLAQLAALERQKIEDEYNALLARIAELEAILGDETKILEIIKGELTAIKDKYGDPRRTIIHPNAVGEFSAMDLIPDEPVVVALTQGNYVKRLPIDTYRAQNRGGRGVMGMATKDEDEIVHLSSATTHDDIFFFTNTGRVFQTKVYEIPTASRQAKGSPLVNVIQISNAERVTAIMTQTSSQDNSGAYFIFATKQGIIKRTLIEAYKNVRKTGIVAMRLDKGDELKWVNRSNGEDQIFQATSKGQAISYLEDEVRPVGRSAGGVKGINLRTGDEVISMDVIPTDLKEQPDLLIVLENGFGKRTSFEHFRTQHRGGLGLKCANVTSRTGNVIAIEVIKDGTCDALLISKQGVVIRTPVKEIRRLGRDTQGVTLMKMQDNDAVASVTLLEKEDDIEKIPEATV